MPWPPARPPDHNTKRPAGDDSRPAAPDLLHSSNAASRRPNRGHMLRPLRSASTYANVMATIAVFVALGGSSYAALRVTGRNVPKDALTGADIKNLTGKDVSNNSLTGADVKNKSLTPKDF